MRLDGWGGVGSPSRNLRWQVTAICTWRLIPRDDTRFGRCSLARTGVEKRPKASDNTTASVPHSPASRHRNKPMEFDVMTRATTWDHVATLARRTEGGLFRHVHRRPSGP